MLEDDNEWLHWLQVGHRIEDFLVSKSRSFDGTNWINLWVQGGSKTICIKSVELSGHSEDWKMVLRVGVFRLLNSFQDEVLEVLIQDQYPTNVDRRGHHFHGDFVKWRWWNWRMMIPVVFVVELLNQNNSTKRDTCELVNTDYQDACLCIFLNASLLEEVSHRTSSNVRNGHWIHILKSQNSLNAKQRKKAPSQWGPFRK